MARRLAPARPGLARVIALVALAGLVVSPTALAAHDNDAGTGTDAPNTHQAAVDVPLQTFEGALDVNAGDDRDWYRLHVPADKLVRVIVEATGDGYVRLDVRHDDGRYWTYGSAYPGSPKVLDLFKYSPGVFRLGLYNTYDSAAYRVSFLVEDLPDGRVDAIGVRALNFKTDTGDLQTGTLREVSVTISNVGDAATGAASLRVWVTSTGSAVTNAPRDLGTVTTSLDVGETRTFTFTWDAMGQFGDAIVHARVTTPWDDDTTNDAATARGYAMLGNAGVGVDALSHDVRTPRLILVGSIGTGVSWDADHKGAYGWGPLVSAGAGFGPGGRLGWVCAAGTCHNL